MELFEIEIIFPVTSGLIDEEEISDVKQLQTNAEGFDVEVGYWDLTTDPIVQMNPKCFIPKVNKRYFTEVVFLSGNISLANYKPKDLKRLIDEYLTK